MKYISDFNANAIGQFHNYVCDIQRTQLNNFPTKTGILMIIVCLYINATYK